MVGTLNIISIPEGAKIFLDGVDTTFIAPYSFLELSGGIHKYRLSLNSYLDIAGTVEVIENQQSTLVVTLPDDFYNKLITLTMVGLGLSVVAMFMKK